MVLSLIGAFSSISVAKSKENVIEVSPTSNTIANEEKHSLPQEITRVKSNTEENSPIYIESKIFKFQYEADDKSYTKGKFTVDSADGSNVVAPGTKNDGTFYLKNICGKSCNLDYGFYCEYNSDVIIPIEVKLIDGTGKYILGNADSFVAAMELNNISGATKMQSDEVLNFTLPWKWEFFISDEQDKLETSWGNRAVNEDLTITIGMKIQATPEPDPGPDPQPDPEVLPIFVQTSDTIPLWFAAVFALIIIACAIAMKRYSKNTENKAEERKENMHNIRKEINKIKYEK